MSEPTKGPYAVRRNWSNGCEVCPAVVAADGKWVAEIVGAPYLGFEETLPTAALLAASWDLLKAARQALECLTSDDETMYEHPESPYHFLWAAICKAEGKGVAQ